MAERTKRTNYAHCSGQSRSSSPFHVSSTKQPRTGATPRAGPGPFLTRRGNVALSVHQWRRREPALRTVHCRAGLERRLRSSAQRRADAGLHNDARAIRKTARRRNLDRTMRVRAGRPVADVVLAGTVAIVRRRDIARPVNATACALRPTVHARAGQER